MKTKFFYHLCADGDDARNFIVAEVDFIVAFNLVGVCAANCNVIVVCFSIEDSHPHFLLFGYYEDCLRFKEMYEDAYRHHIVSSRGSLDDVRLDLEIICVDNEDYLRNVGTYIVSQPTKDGKDIMPFDYPWGSGCLYFRRGPFVPVWRIDQNGKLLPTQSVGNMTYDQKQAILHSRKSVPDDWTVCNGLLLPTNYVDIHRFESIYRTCNCYRAFLASGKNKDNVVLEKMSSIRGVAIEDLEARRLCGITCKTMFGVKDIRRLSSIQRVELAGALRKEYKLSFRQLATIVRLPESEIRKYIH